MRYAKEYSKALENMPESFSSRTFYDELRKMGVDNNALTSGGPNYFLKLNTRQRADSNSFWYKTNKTTKSPELFPIMQHPPVPKEITEDEAVAFLKSKGYKIFKYAEV